MSEGVRIIINTTRSEISEVEEYLKKHHIPYDYINHNPDNDEQELSQSKVLADCYVDDRSLRFEGSWGPRFANEILYFKPWWK